MPSTKGSLLLILGPMKSAKSHEMIRRVERYLYAKKNCLILRPSEDTRPYLSRRTEPSPLIATKSIPTLKLYDDLYVSNPEYQKPGMVLPDVFGIDEVSLFPDPEYLDKWADMGKIIIACGLNGTAEKDPWDPVQRLIPLADDIYYTHAVCSDCGDDASFTWPLFDHVPGETVIGDDYIPLCRSCYNKRFAYIKPHEFN